MAEGQEAQVASLTQYKEKKGMNALEEMEGMDVIAPGISIVAEEEKFPRRQRTRRRMMPITGSPHLSPLSSPGYTGYSHTHTHRYYIV